MKKSKNREQTIPLKLRKRIRKSDKFQKLDGAPMLVGPFAGDLIAKRVNINVQGSFVINWNASEPIPKWLKNFIMEEKSKR